MRDSIYKNCRKGASFIIKKKKNRSTCLRMQNHLSIASFLNWLVDRGTHVSEAGVTPGRRSGRFKDKGSHVIGFPFQAVHGEKSRAWRKPLGPGLGLSS